MLDILRFILSLGYVAVIETLRQEGQNHRNHLEKMAYELSAIQFSLGVFFSISLRFNNIVQYLRTFYAGIARALLPPMYSISKS